MKTLSIKFVAWGLAVLLLATPGISAAQGLSAEVMHTSTAGSAGGAFRALAEINGEEQTSLTALSDQELAEVQGQALILFFIAGLAIGSLIKGCERGRQGY
jgi:hypothetical protein